MHMFSVVMVWVYTLFSGILVELIFWYSGVEEVSAPQVTHKLQPYLLLEFGKQQRETDLAHP